MAANTFGKLFTITTFGESHGDCIGVVIDGCPAGVSLTESIIDTALARRKPTNSIASTTRKESDKSQIISGVFDNKSTGMPITILIRNTDAVTADYDILKDVYRPGHADYTYNNKYGNNDYRGGGRASGRETAVRVAAGAVAKQMLLNTDIDLFAYVIQIGNIRATTFDKAVIDNNSYRCADANILPTVETLLTKLKSDGDSTGSVIELRINAVPIGLGEPVFDKLSARLAYAMMGIPAVKGIEIGDGFAATSKYGSENNDQLSSSGFISNHAGGILGGISTGQEIIMRIAVKPVPTIAKLQHTITKAHTNTTITGTGRHDVCLGPRITAVIEAMAWVTLADMYLLYKIQHTDEMKQQGPIS